MSIYDEVIAIEDLILASQALTLTDAAVQLMMATARLATLSCTELDQEQPNIELVRARVKVVERALWSVTKVCAPVAGLRLADVAGDSYVPSYLDSRPDIDVSGVSDADLGERFACDGTAPAVEA